MLYALLVWATNKKSNLGATVKRNHIQLCRKVEANIFNGQMIRMLFGKKVKHSLQENLSTVNTQNIR